MKTTNPAKQYADRIAKITAKLEREGLVEEAAALRAVATRKVAAMR